MPKKQELRTTIPAIELIQETPNESEGERRNDKTGLSACPTETVFFKKITSNPKASAASL